MHRSNEHVLLDERSGTGSGLEGFPASRLASLVTEAPELARRLLRAGVEEQADASLVFRSLSAIMLRALDGHDRGLLTGGIDSFNAIWALGDPKVMYSIKTPAFEASLWERLAVELYALAGFAVLRELWGEMRALVLVRPDESPSDVSWLRQGQVASSRASTYPDENILDMAARRMVELDAQSKPDALTSVCRLDLLAAMIICEFDRDGFFPNCAPYSESLVEPIVIDGLRDSGSPLRQAVFRDDSKGLRAALREFDAMARSQAALARRNGHSWKWRAFADARTWTYIDEGHLLEEFEKAGRDGWR